MNGERNELKPEVIAYLARIGLQGPIDGSASALAELQACHIHAVPYENLDILRGIPLSLDIPHLLEKIVHRRRGGYCFELNALFGWLLRELGYPVSDYFGRFWRDEPNPPPMRRHHVLKVEADGESFLCDVGVGGVVPVLPIRLIEGEEQRQGNECYRMERDDYFGWILCELKHGEWSRIYSFTEEPQLPQDFEITSYWCQHAPESIFTNNAMMAIRTKDGRHTVAGNEFRLFTAAGVRVFVPESEEAYREALRDYFGIVIDS